jgi:hypothetical protein
VLEAEVLKREVVESDEAKQALDFLKRATKAAAKARARDADADEPEPPPATPEVAAVAEPPLATP